MSSRGYYFFHSRACIRSCMQLCLQCIPSCNAIQHSVLLQWIERSKTECDGGLTCCSLGGLGNPPPLALPLYSRGAAGSMPLGGKRRGGGKALEVLNIAVGENPVTAKSRKSWCSFFRDSQTKFEFNYFAYKQIQFNISLRISSSRRSGNAENSPLVAGSNRKGNSNTDSHLPPTELHATQQNLIEDAYDCLLDSRSELKFKLAEFFYSLLEFLVG
jgi:hypothetical protein